MWASVVSQRTLLCAHCPLSRTCACLNKWRDSSAILSPSEIGLSSATQSQRPSPLLSLESSLLRIFKAWVKSSPSGLVCWLRAGLMPYSFVVGPHPDSGSTSVVDNKSDFTFWLCRRHCHRNWMRAQRIVNKELFSNKYQKEKKRSCLSFSVLSSSPGFLHGFSWKPSTILVST